MGCRVARIRRLRTLATKVRLVGLRARGLLAFGCLEHVACSAFSGCVAKLRLPATIRRIGARAFESCGLSTISGGGAALDYIGDSAFGGCDSLQTVVDFVLPASYSWDAFPNGCRFGCGAIVG